MTSETNTVLKIELSIIIPMRNEVENLGPLILEITRAMKNLANYEIICVDDGSKDGTLANLIALKDKFENLRIYHHEFCKGQSSAIVTGIHSAKGGIIITLDGDGQNDPADIPKLLALYKKEIKFSEIMVIGWRTQRQDSLLRKISSYLANLIRSLLLSDSIPDSGCGLKVFSRKVFLAMPHFDHMHRFLPVLMIRSGGRVFSLAVNHRPRVAGNSNYGVWNRLWIGMIDLFGVMWLIRRPIREIPNLEQERLK